MKFKNFFLNFFGIFYIAIAIIAFYDNIITFGFPSVLWFSYAAYLLIGIGILMRNSFIIGSQLNIVFVPYVIWTIDYLYLLFTSRSLWGVADFVFTGRFLSQIVMIQHIFIIPIALIAVYFIKLKRKDFWKWSLVQITIIFILTKIFTDPARNTNCVFENCLPFEIKSFYPLIWFAVYIPVIFLINFILTKIRAFKFKKK